jgi:hypothetical protein
MPGAATLANAITVQGFATSPSNTIKLGATNS